MKLDSDCAQYGREAAVIGQKVEAFGGDYWVGDKHYLVVHAQMRQSAFYQAVLFKINQVCKKIFFATSGHFICKFGAFNSVWMGFGELVKQFQLIFSINAHDVWRPCQFKLFKMITRLTPLNQGGVQ